MKCEAFETRLQHLLDARQSLSLDSSLTAHAMLCPACGKRLQAMQQLFQGLEQWEPPADCPDVAALVVQSWQQEYRRTALRRWLLSTAAAAVVLVAVGLAWNSWNSRPSQPALGGVTQAQPAATSPNRAAPDSPTLANASPRVGPNAQRPSSPRIGDLTKQAKERYESLAGKTRSSLADVGKLLPKTSGNTADGAPSAVDRVSGSSLGMVKRTAGNWMNPLAPVSNSAAHTMDSLLRPFSSDTPADGS